MIHQTVVLLPAGAREIKTPCDCYQLETREINWCFVTVENKGHKTLLLCYGWSKGHNAVFFCISHKSKAVSLSAGAKDIAQFYNVTS